MTPEREGQGRGPRKDKAAPALRSDPGGREPKEERRPSQAWKKTAARMSREQKPPEEPAARNDTPEPCAPVEPGPFPAGEVPRQAETDTGPEAAPGNGDAAPASGQSVPKYRQKSVREAADQGGPASKLRQESSQAPPSERLRREDGGTGRRRGAGASGQTASGGSSNGTGGEKEEPQKVRKARQRMERREGKLNGAREKLADQKPAKSPGPVKQAAGLAGRSVHSFVHGKIYEVEQENVGTEGAHRAELAGEAAGRNTLRFAKNRVRTHPARAVRRVESRYVRAAADLRFQQAAAENPELSKNVLSRLWRKRQQRKRYQKQAREAAKQSARAAEKTAVMAEKAAARAVGFVKRHPLAVAVIIICVLLLVVMQSCTSSLTVIGNGIAGSVTATTYPAEDADLLGAEAAYAGLEAELQNYLDGYESAHSYDEYHFDLDSIEHDPYVLLSILSSLHEEGWTLADVRGDLQTLFDQQYTLTESVTVEVRYRTETRTDSEGGSYEVEVPYNYYICTVTLENFDLSHLPVYLLGEDGLSRYSLFMASLGNRPDLFPSSPYVGRYGGNVTRYEIPPEALEDEQFAAMIAEAEKYLGYPYVWGGSSPATSFDCSGFVSWVINHCGVGWDFGRLGSDGLYFNVCTPVSPSEAKPGDLIFFQHTYDTPNTSHVGIYVGNGMMIHCGDPIQYTSINTSYWQEHFYGFGRLPSVD